MYSYFLLVYVSSCFCHFVCSRSQSISFEGDCDSGPYLFHLDFRCSLFDFCVIYFTLKYCFYTIVHLLLQELIISLKSSLSTQSLCHTISLRVGVGVPQKQELRIPAFVTATCNKHLLFKKHPGVNVRIALIGGRSTVDRSGFISRRRRRASRRLVNVLLITAN